MGCDAREREAGRVDVVELHRGDAMSRPNYESETTRIARDYLRKLQSSVPAAPAESSRPSSQRPPPRDPPPQPAFSGYRVMWPGRRDVFLVDPEGYLRQVSDRPTYDRLFRDWTGIVDAWPDAMPQGAPLGPGTMLVRAASTRRRGADGDARDAVYLVDRGRRRLVTSDAVMAKYWFAPDRVVSLPDTVLGSIPAGPDWE